MRCRARVAILLGTALGLAACGSGGGGGAATYGPSGAQFTAAFPSSPKTIHMPAGAGQGLPAGTKGTMFGVGDVNPSSRNRSPHVPAFGVIVEVVPGASGAGKVAAYMKGLGDFAKSSGGHAVTVGGATGYKITGSERALTGGDNGDSKARAAEMFLSRGNVIYVVGAFSDSQADVNSFIASFKPA